MPTVIVEGRTLDIGRKRQLVLEITEVVSRIYEWPRERIIVVIHENSDENAARGGILLADRRPMDRIDS